MRSNPLTRLMGCGDLELALDLWNQVPRRCYVAENGLIEIGPRPEIPSSPVPSVTQTINSFERRLRRDFFFFFTGH